MAGVTSPLQPTLSVIIPVSNEEENLVRLLAELRQQQEITLELLVADGGSRDRGEAVAARFGARWVVSAPGRGEQMNTAAALAQAPHLLFLHADSVLPDPRLLATAMAAMAAVAHPRVAGHFPLAFATEDPQLARHLRFHAAKSRLNRPGCFNGDQGLLISQAYFQELGGFDTSLPYLEDHRIARRIQRGGQWLTLPGTLITSARRFEQEGYLPRTWLNMLILLLENAGEEGFLREAPGFYRQQRESGSLRVSFFLGCIHALHRAMSWDRWWRHWLLLARHARREAWQLFLWVGLDKPDPFRAVAWHDRWFHPLVNHGSGDLIALLVVMGWFHASRLGWAWRERKRE